MAPFLPRHLSHLASKVGSIIEAFAGRFAHVLADPPVRADTNWTRHFHHGATLNGMSSLGEQHEHTMQTKDKRKPVGYIFRTWITIKGERRYAKDYGLKAWRIPIYR
jgi:hypothetical protein